MFQMKCIYSRIVLQLVYPFEQISTFSIPTIIIFRLFLPLLFSWPGSCCINPSNRISGTFILPTAFSLPRPVVQHLAALPPLTALLLQRHHAHIYI
jgi:hypothetical protein